MTRTFRRQLLSQFSLLIAFTSSLALPLIAHAQADNYPSKPITLVVPNPPGGLVDTSARLVSDPLAKLTGQSVVVDNKPGGSGNLAYSNVEIGRAHV